MIIETKSDEINKEYVGMDMATEIRATAYVSYHFNIGYISKSTT